ncbi:MAG: dCMP deaminase family protein [Proteobacteria bacterium]|nr:dCMP deaminase family protein [Pseudomonadota bacterium]
MKDSIIQSELSWDEYFMNIAYFVSKKSKDPSTKVGAVIVGPDKEIRSTGYNSMPRGVKDSFIRYTKKELKYLIISHAEESAIMNCVRVGVSTKNCVLYVPWHPCCSCAKLIIQSGIKEIVIDGLFPRNTDPGPWKQSMDIAKEILGEAAVAIRSFDNKIFKIP